MSERLTPILLDVPSELVGDRILLRAFRDSDAPELWNAVDTSRERLARWMPWVKDHNSLEFSREYVRRMQARWILREDMPMGIWRKHDGQLLGAAGLHRFDWQVPTMEIGYWTRTEAEGKGYVTESVELIKRFAFEHLRAERVTILCDSRNLRSAGVPRRAGFVHEVTRRGDRRNAEGDLSDTEVFAMTRADFNALHG
jgi:RimJ/RimL family protein N-acetyltransferase